MIDLSKTTSDIVLDSELVLNTFRFNDKSIGQVAEEAEIAEGTTNYYPVAIRNGDESADISSAVSIISQNTSIDGFKIFASVGMIGKDRTMYPYHNGIGVCASNVFYVPRSTDRKGTTFYDLIMGSFSKHLESFADPTDMESDAYDRHGKLSSCTYKILVALDADKEFYPIIVIRAYVIVDKVIPAIDRVKYKHLISHRGEDYPNLLEESLINPVSFEEYVASDKVTGFENENDPGYMYMARFISKMTTVEDLDSLISYSIEAPEENHN